MSEPAEFVSATVVRCPKCGTHTKRRHAKLSMIRDGSGNCQAICDECGHKFLVSIVHMIGSPPLEAKEAP